MLAPELKKLKEDLETGKSDIKINSGKLLEELKELDNVECCLHESLALSQKLCPTCGRRLV